MSAASLDFRAPRSRPRDWLALGVAGVAHLALAWSAATSPTSSPEDPTKVLSIALDELPVLREPSPPEPEPVAPPPDQDAIRVPSPHAVSTPAPITHAESVAAGDSETAAPAEAAPLLTDAFGDADWALVSGQGTMLGGTGTSKGGLGGGSRNTFLKPRDFSRDPIPPDLSRLVQINYPVSARMNGIEGHAVVSLIVNADGVPSDVRVDSVEPSHRGLGEACQRTVLQGGAWKPKLNQNGHPLAANATFTCRFTRGPSQAAKNDSAAASSAN